MNVGPHLLEELKKKIWEITGEKVDSVIVTYTTEKRAHTLLKGRPEDIADLAIKAVEGVEKNIPGAIEDLITERMAKMMIDNLFKGTGVKQ